MTSEAHLKPAASNHSNAFNPTQLRRTVLDMAYSGATAHIACAFSLIEILAVLYRHHLRYPGGRFDHPLRDYLVLSKGHGVMAQYACLQEIGWIAPSEIQSYFKNGTRLRGLSEAEIPGLEVTSGSLGHGLSVGVGLALAAKRKRTDQMCYAVIGDGEANEGSIWEAIQFAVHFELSNLVIIVDENGQQAMGATEDVMKPGDLVAKFNAFGFDAVSVDGHNEELLHKKLLEMENKKDARPKAIVAKTVKGKGVSFMEGNNIWHYTRLNPERYAMACKELEMAVR